MTLFDNEGLRVSDVITGSIRDRQRDKERSATEDRSNNRRNSEHGLLCSPFDEMSKTVLIILRDG